MRIIQIYITNTILHYIIYDAIQRGWIEQMVLIFAGINTKIVTGRSSPVPPIWNFPKVTHILEDLFLWLIIIFKDLRDKGKGFQHIGRKRRLFHILLCLLHLFCFCCSHTGAFTRLSQTSFILFILSSAISINHNTLSCIRSVNNIHVNQLYSPLNNIGMLTHEHMTSFYLGNLFRGKKSNKIKNILLRPRRLTTRSLHDKYINNRHYISSFYYYHIFASSWHGIIIGNIVVPKMSCISHLNS